MKRVRPLLALMVVLAAPAPARLLAEGDAEPRYEMTTYYLAFLYRGPSWTPDVTPEIQTLQKAHLANIGRLAKEGKMAVAGPFADDTKLRGVLILTVGSMEEAKAACDSDPMVQAGRLVAEIHPWMAAKVLRIDPPVARKAADEKK